MRLFVAVLVIASSVPASAQGAKALFYDTTSGVSVQSSGTVPAASRPTKTPSPKAPRAARGNSTTGIQPVSQSSSAQPIATGIMYWIELKTGNNELARVNSSRIFQPGDRIRLHLTSNTDGQLVVMQSQNSSPFGVLFPSSGKTTEVWRFEEQILPSATGWFRFDQQPGAIKLMVMITPSSDEVPSAPGPATSGSFTASAPLDEKLGKQDGQLEASVRKQLDLQQGSKSLVVENDSSPQGAAEYVALVKGQRIGHGSSSSAPLALEIDLTER